MTDFERIICRLGDTKWGTKWSDFLKMIEAAGFKVAYHNTFDGMSINQTEEHYKEEEYIFYHEAGYVLYAESICCGTSYAGINKANLYYEAIQHHEDDWGELIPYDGELQVYCDDVRTNFLRHLDYIPLLKTVNPVWTIKNPFIWFVNYKDDDEPGYDYKAISRRKIEASVPELRKIIDGE